MTGWALNVPHRDRDEPLTAVAAHARHLDGDDRAVARRIAIAAQLDGMQSAGELIDHLAELSPGERRGILDRARAEVGLPSTAEVEAAQPKPLEVRRVNGAGGFPACAAEGCNAVPMRAGVFYSPGVRKWWCPAARRPGRARRPRAARLRHPSRPAGVPIDFDPAADARDRERERSRRAQLAAQADDRRVEAAEAAASKRGERRGAPTELPRLPPREPSMNATTYAARWSACSPSSTRPVPSRAPTREHLLLKASVVLADKGTFEAIISTESVDREKDIVLADAMVDALQAWTPTGKLIPLLWSHSSAARGHHRLHRPGLARRRSTARSAHRDGSTRRHHAAGRRGGWSEAGVLGFSFGYLIGDAVKRADGVREIRELDVFEISACACR